ncbi:hypothetical protein [Pannonibacter sp. SL95]|uniref:hypothetical protein n=1 Tax=Pannonibacter sp. SL95 TaxID=2995153 RepID=UPI002DD427F1|nr:hypothetical protein [Pannonibacter sp. SL95]
MSRTKLDFPEPLRPMTAMRRSLKGDIEIREHGLAAAQQGDSGEDGKVGAARIAGGGAGSSSCS